jgi:peptide/nickel transport system ATP-binding protein
MKNNVLMIKNLTFGYTKDKLIYENFNLKIERNQLISIVGASGSGKSTLFELIGKNLRPISGKIETLSISSIYQDPYSSFHPSYKILEQITDVVDDMSELVFLCENLKLSTELLEKKPHELSGGQLQRCSILRAILMKPDLLLADEPTSALDNVIALDVMKLLIKFLDRFGILLITHDDEMAAWCSDKIINIGELQNNE